MLCLEHKIAKILKVEYQPWIIPLFLLMLKVYDQGHMMGYNDSFLQHSKQSMLNI